MKKKAIKLVAASLVAASAFVAIAPLQSQAASNLMTTVDQAVMQMQKPYHAYSDVTATGKFADINDVYKEYNAAKAAYADAKAAVLKAGGSQKDVLLAKLDSSYEAYITKRVIPYIDAYNYITRDLMPLYEGLKAAKAKKDLVAVVKYYHAISYQLKKRTPIIYSVYGKSTRYLFQEYKDKAQALRDEFVYDVTVVMKLEEVMDAFAAGKSEVAKAAIEQINKLLPNVSDTFRDQIKIMITPIHLTDPVIK